MTPEPLAAPQRAGSGFSVNGMDCPVEEKLIRSKLAGMPGVLGLDFNLMQRVLKVRHEPGLFLPYPQPWRPLNMDARLL